MRRSSIRRSLTPKLLAAQLAVIVAGSATLALVALLLGPTLFHRHVREALGYVPPTVLHHLDQAFGQSLALSLGLGIAAATATAAGVSLARLSPDRAPRARARRRRAGVSPAATTTPGSASPATTS